MPILSLGTSLHLPQIMLNSAFKWGVTHWDTANSYMGGNSERRIGRYFSKRPQNRRKIFLVTKSHACPRMIWTCLIDTLGKPVRIIAGDVGTVAKPFFPRLRPSEMSCAS